MNKQTKVEIFLGRIFIFLVLFVLSFLIVDYLSIFFVSNRSPFEQQFAVGQARHPKPYVMFGGVPGGGIFNSQGYMGKVPTMPKQEGEFRVFMLGGSTVVNGSPPLAELLEQHFVSVGSSHVKIYNYGVVSSGSGQDLARIVYEVSDLEPNLIIFYNGANDIINPRIWDPRPGYPFNFIVYENNPLLESSVKDYPSLALIAYGSNIVRSLMPNFFVHKFVSLHSMRENEGWMTEDWKEKIATAYLNNVVRASKISKAFGADFIVFFQPLLYFKYRLADQEKPLLLDKRYYYLDIREKIVSRIARIKKESGAQVVDFSRIYQDDSDWVFTDFVHTRQDSKKKVAEAMFNHLLSLRLIRAPKNENGIGESGAK